MFGGLDILLIAIILSCVYTKSKWGGYQFDKAATSTLRGMAMAAIIIHHVANATNDSPITKVIGYLATGVFFFIAGYGNEYSLQKPSGKSIIWLGKKVKKLYLPFFVGYMSFLLVLLIIQSGYFPSSQEATLDFITFSLPGMETWFPKVILLCFAIHWVASKWFPKIHSLIVMGAIIGYVLLAHKFHLAPYWYNSVILYPIGGIFAVDEKVKVVMSNNIILLLLMGLMTAIELIIQSRNSILLQIVSCIIFSVILYIVTQKIKIYNRFLSWVGKSSFEYYIFHYTFLEWFSTVNNKYIYFLTTFIGTTLCVYAYKKLSKIINAEFVR